MNFTQSVLEKPLAMETWTSLFKAGAANMDGKEYCSTNWLRLSPVCLIIAQACWTSCGTVSPKKFPLGTGFDTHTKAQGTKNEFQEKFSRQKTQTATHS